MNRQIVVRVRPYRPEEKALGLSVLVTPTHISLYRSADSAPLSYPVNCTIWSNGEEADLGLEHVDNRGVYERIGRGIVGKVIGGEDCCVIACGANATGKTYTLFGNSEETGLIQLAAMELMTSTHSLSISMLELHENCIKDLFTGQDSLPFHSTPQSLSIQSLSSRGISTPQDLEVAISLGRRAWASDTPRMNALSKPTHVLVEFKTILSDGREVSLQFVDLAGEEHTARTGVPRKETIAVNQSIRVFKDTIKALAAQRQGKNAMVPFRESVLTQVLRRPLEGSVFTTFLATIAPCSLQENRDTLNLCQFLQNRPVPT